METFASGAQRSEKKPRFDLIPTVALERLAARLQLGAETYSEYQWQKGLPPEDTLNHILAHLLHWRDVWRETGQPPADDDLAAAMWGCMALMWFEAEGKVEWGTLAKTAESPGAPLRTAPTPIEVLAPHAQRTISISHGHGMPPVDYIWDAAHGRWVPKEPQA